MRVDLRDDEMTEVQMTPMIDCVFLLLIFFLVATTLKKIDKELPLELPEAMATLDVQQPNEYVAIGVDRDGNYFLDAEPISLGLLQSRLRAQGAENVDVKIRLDADRAAPFQRVMQVLDMLRFEGLKNVGVNTRKDG